MAKTAAEYQALLDKVDDATADILDNGQSVGTDGMTHNKADLAQQIRLGRVCASSGNGQQTQHSQPLSPESKRRSASGISQANFPSAQIFYTVTRPSLQDVNRMCVENADRSIARQLFYWQSAGPG